MNSLLGSGFQAEGATTLRATAWSRGPPSVAFASGRTKNYYKNQE